MSLFTTKNDRLIRCLWLLGAILAFGSWYPVLVTHNYTETMVLDGIACVCYTPMLVLIVIRYRKANKELKAMIAEWDETWSQHQEKAKEVQDGKDK